ncbi:MAG: hypothetical protein ACXVLM_16880 [Ilumatobacteraceae bacterium]
MTDLQTPTVNLIGNGPLPARQVVVLRSLSGLGRIVATNQWCLIGGLMVEILLTSRGGLMLRPTDDGDIIGDVVGDRSVLRKLARGLIDMGFEELPAGRAGMIGVRFREPASGAFIDILAPEASLRLRKVVPTQSDKRALEAPGTDVAIETATEVSVTYAVDEPPLTIRVPSVLGAIYAKATAWHVINNARESQKHLQDAAALLTIARLAELRDAPKPIRKRLVWLHGELVNTNSVGWQYVTAQPRADAIARLSTALHINAQ